MAVLGADLAQGLAHRLRFGNANLQDFAHQVHGVPVCHFRSELWALLHELFPIPN